MKMHSKNNGINMFPGYVLKVLLLVTKIMFVQSSGG